MTRRSVRDHDRAHADDVPDHARGADVPAVALGDGHETEDAAQGDAPVLLTDVLVLHDADLVTANVTATVTVTVNVTVTVTVIVFGVRLLPPNPEVLRFLCC